MEIIYGNDALLDIKFWKKSGNIQIQKKISELIKDIIEHPEIGIGKPEQLKHEFLGYWSRRINGEHRIIYKVENEKLHIASLRGHYEK